MRQKLFTVEDNFRLDGRLGIVVTGELEDDSPSFKIGNAVVLVTPNGAESTTEISGIETVCRLEYENYNWRKVGIMLKDIFEKEDIPIGTEIYLYKTE